MTVARYGGLKKATIIVRDDGLFDVVRERENTGERINGCATLEEAFDAIRAHGSKPPYCAKHGQYSCGEKCTAPVRCTVPKSTKG